jgi:hypothetical protein
MGITRRKDGGAEGIRTPDPHNAIVVLYQLSYDPIQSEECKAPAAVVKTFPRIELNARPESE